MSRSTHALSTHAYATHALRTEAALHQVIEGCSIIAATTDGFYSVQFLVFHINGQRIHDGLKYYNSSF